MVGWAAALVAAGMIHVGFVLDLGGNSTVVYFGKCLLYFGFWHV
jgi:hypothetical protein